MSSYLFSQTATKREKSVVNKTDQIEYLFLLIRPLSIRWTSASANTCPRTVLQWFISPWICARTQGKEHHAFPEMVYQLSVKLYPAISTLMTLKLFYAISRTTQLSVKLGSAFQVKHHGCFAWVTKWFSSLFFSVFYLNNNYLFILCVQNPLL